jgi:hypothetical protein
MSSHHWAAGTAKCTMPVISCSGPSRPTCRASGLVETGHTVWIVASWPNIAGTPSASQAQLAHHEDSPLITRKAVGLAEKGMAIRISPDPG